MGGHRGVAAKLALPTCSMDISNIKRILITRTDRIGDVILSLPTIKATREAFPDAYIAMMVSPRISELVCANPSLNEVIIYDKKKQKGIFKLLSFVKELKKKRFDIALILHSTVRVNLLCFLAGIPKRIGYERGKMDFLLTDGLEDIKRMGEKHEAEYSLDILRYLGVAAKLALSKVEGLALPVLSIKKEDEERINKLLKARGLNEGERFVILHPCASCISKMWPYENFAKVGDSIIQDFGMRVIINLHPDQVGMGEKVRSLMKNEPIFLCDKTTLGELSALFKKASLVISNDSGPAHIASLVATAVISIFGRNQKGLSPVRWKPLGDKSIALHKDVGCAECLAHNCKKGFLCLKAITPEEVLKEAGKLLAV